jgi:hypothetical protein
VYVWPGFTGGWVMNGTPSWSFGSSRPWKWIAVDSVSSFLRIDAHAIAFRHANLRTRHLAVERHRRYGLTRGDFPAHLLRGELVDLHALVHARLEGLASLPLRFCRERLDPGFVHAVHLVRFRKRSSRGDWLGCAIVIRGVVRRDGRDGLGFAAITRRERSSSYGGNR